MDTLITAVRIPLGCVFSLFLLVVAWPLEFIIGLAILPWKVIALSREDLKKEYSKWPLNSIEAIHDCWNWVYRG